MLAKNAQTLIRHKILRQYKSLIKIIFLPETDSITKVIS